MCTAVIDVEVQAIAFVKDSRTQSARLLSIVIYETVTNYQADPFEL